MMTAPLVPCYNKLNGSIIISLKKPTCGPPSAAGFFFCCKEGHTCGLDGFCHFPYSGDGASGYYIGGCTDPTFTDSSCSQECDSFPLQDAVYNYNTQLWACCFSNPEITRNCSSPLNNITFQAPAPDVLFAKPLSSSTATLTQNSTSAVSSSSNSPTTSPVQNSGISQSAAAGIGVGVGIGGILLGVLLSFILIRYRKGKNKQSPIQLRPPARSVPKTHDPSRAEMQHHEEVFYRTRQLDSVTLVTRTHELPDNIFEADHNEKR